MSAPVRTVLVASVLGLLLASVGCSRAPELDGTAWRLSAWSVSSIDPTSVTITAVFADGQIGGVSAVNSYGGPYKTGVGGAFEVGEIVSTLMAGPEPAARAETAYHNLLTRAREYSIAGDTLTLRDADRNELLVFTRE